MTKESFEEYRAILDKYKFPYKNEEDVLEIVANIRELARVILSFEEKKKRNKILCPQKTK